MSSMCSANGGFCAGTALQSRADSRIDDSVPDKDLRRGVREMSGTVSGKQLTAVEPALLADAGPAAGVRAAPSGPASPRAFCARPRADGKFILSCQEKICARGSTYG